MDMEKYRDILLNGDRRDWYGEQVPIDLITNLVNAFSINLLSEIRKLESTLTELKGVKKDRRQAYIDGLWDNLKNAPYTLNNDVYLKKKKRIEEELESKTKKTTTKKKRKTYKKRVKKKK